MKYLLNKLEKRIIDISYKNKSSHLSSCLTAVGLIDKIYLSKKKNDVFVLSNGHAFLALAVVLEKEEGKNAEELALKHGTHPNRDIDNGIYVSTGSLGQGLPIAVGMAIADRSRDVWVLLSDGECAEGSIWESLRIAAELRLENLKIVVNANGYSAYNKVDLEYLEYRLKTFYPILFMRTDMYKYPDFLQGEMGHYKVLTEEEYKELNA